MLGSVLYTVLYIYDYQLITHSSQLLLARSYKRSHRVPPILSAANEVLYIQRPIFLSKTLIDERNI